MSVTVNRRDIHLYEEQLAVALLVRIPNWTATLDGALSTGEHVEMSRSGNSFTEALANLEKAIAENGWEIR